jgi:hypothetical protein
MKRMDVVIDLETLGRTPGAVIVEIGAALVPWEDLAERATFSERITVASGFEVGLHVEPETVAWWFDTAPVSAFAGMGRRLERHLNVVLLEFAEWLERIAGGGTLLVWGNGATFDLGILAEAYRRTGIPLPWEYWSERDLRTALDPALCRKRVEKPAVVEHRACADAVAESLRLAAVLDRKWGAE